MKKSLLTLQSVIILLIIAVGYTASAQSKNTKPPAINFQEIIGKWRHLKTQPSINLEAIAGKPSKTADTATATPRGASVDKAKFQGMHKATMVFRGSMIEFLTNKTAVKTVANKAEQYSWSKNKKNRLTLKNKETKEKTKYEVLTLKSDTLRLFQSFETGSVTILFLRVK